MKKFFLDTSFIIDLINEEEKALDIHEKTKGKEITGTLCLYELLKFSEKLTPLFKKELVPLEKEDADKASQIYQELKSKGEPIADIDVLIAGIVANRGYTLITRDEDFKRIGDIDLQTYKL